MQRSIYIFLSLTLLLSLPFYYIAISTGELESLGSLGILGLMWSPGIAGIITNFITSHCRGDAYGVEIKRELGKRLKEKLSVGSIQSVLKQIEEKEFLISEFGESTQKRGGKRNRIYTATPYAHRVLKEMKEIRAGLWRGINLYPRE